MFPVAEKRYTPCVRDPTQSSQLCKEGAGVADKLYCGRLMECTFFSLGTGTSSVVTYFGIEKLRNYTCAGEAVMMRTSGSRVRLEALLLRPFARTSSLRISQRRS